MHRTITFVYDALGRLTQVTNSRNQTTQFQYDNENRRTQITNSLNQQTKFAYNANGDLQTYTSPKNTLTSYTYDSKRRLLAVTQPGGLQTTYTYDGADRLIRITDPKSQQRNYSYDAANRLTKKEIKVGGVVQSTTTYTYDDADRLLTVSDGTGTWSLTYDLVSRLTRVVSPQGTVDYAYNANSRRTRMTATGQSAVEYDYDLVDRLTDITQGAATFTYAYDALGRRTSLTRPNGVTTTYTYDDANQLTQLHHLKAGVIDELHTLTYDNNGNILTQSRDGGLRTYTYDVLDRLIKMVKTVAVPGEGLPKQIDWTFDANGNITQRKDTADNLTVVSTNFTYNNLDRLTQRTPSNGSSVTFTYDNDGNMTGDSTGRSMSWNGQNQLTQLTAGGMTATFAYDPWGRRTRLTQGGTTENDLYDDMDLLSDGTSQYLHGAVIDEPLSFTTSGTTRSYLADHLGSITQLTENIGVSAATATTPTANCSQAAPQRMQTPSHTPPAKTTGQAYITTGRAIMIRRWVYSSAKIPWGMPCDMSMGIRSISLTQLA